MSQHLEDIEERILNYLGQVSNPLVRMDALHGHLGDAEAESQIPLGELKVFLTQHEHIRVIKPLSEAEDKATSSYAILNTRVPTGQQTSAMMLEQLNLLHEALSIAQVQAQDKADFPRLGEIDEALRRLAALRQKLIEHEAPPEASP